MIAAHRALRRGRATPASPRRRLVWLISATDGHDHAVTIEEMEAGIAAGQGTYRAVCGHLVLVCAMATPPGPPCSSCDELLTTPPPPKPRRWTVALRSMLGRHPEPTAAKHRRRKGHLQDPASAARPWGTLLWRVSSNLNLPTLGAQMQCMTCQGDRPTAGVSAAGLTGTLVTHCVLEAGVSDPAGSRVGR